MLEIIVLVIACLLNGLLGFVVYLKNPTSTTNKLFFLLTGSFVVWSVVNYISLHPVFLSQLEWIRLVLFNAAMLCLLVFLTFHTFPDIRLPTKYRRRAQLATYLTVVVMLLTLTPLVFKSLKISNGQPSPVPSPAIGIFLIQTVGLLGIGIITIINKYRHSTGRLRNQLRLILFGISGTFALIVTTNFLLVVFFGITSLVPFGPAYTLVFSVAFAYAIARHGLFDIRAAIARSVAYLLLIGTMSGVYGVVLFGVIDVLFSGSKYDLLRQVLSVILVTPLALSFQRIKSFFDQATTKIFYRDSYDSQEVLDRVGHIAAAEIELYKILHGIEQVLYNALKPSFVGFVLYKKDRPYFESYPKKVVNQDTMNLGKQIVKQKQDLLVVDDLSTEHALHAHFTAADVALSLKLESNNQVIGYLVLGPKRSGNIYSTQDRRLLLILASEIAIALQNALRFEEIRNFNLTLQASVDEATKKLRRANIKLKALDETKDDFISMASHQLRTPLTSVKGYMSMMLEGDAGKLTKTQQEMLNQAYFSAQRMVYLIADMLNVSRLKTGKFSIDNSPVNLAEVVEQEIGQLKETAAAHSVELTYDKPKEFPTLMLDETKIRQVIMNFADNAIYYTPSGGHIHVKLVDNPHNVELRVIDDGMGVPNSEKHHLFTKFYRAGNARKARPDGTGLGLYMAKKVIVAQHGALIFESEEGKGSTFGFLFNKGQLAAQPAPQPAKT